MLNSKENINSIFEFLNIKIDNNKMEKIVKEFDVNRIDSGEILTSGNAVDFGDLTVARKGGGACDNAHGGL